MVEDFVLGFCYNKFIQDCSIEINIDRESHYP